MERIRKFLPYALLALACLAPLLVMLTTARLDAAAPTLSCILSSEPFTPLLVLGVALLIKSWSQGTRCLTILFMRSHLK